MVSSSFLVLYVIVLQAFWLRSLSFTVESNIWALYNLYISTSGQNWTWHEFGRKWNFSGDISAINPCLDWQGVQCNSSSVMCSTIFPCSVTNLTLIDNGLSGSIPAGMFSNMSELLSVSLANNRIYGCIPGDLFELKQIVSISLESNIFTSTLPPILSKNLEYLVLFENSLSSSIPKSLFALTNLIVLSLNSNFLDGEINGIINMTKLEFLFLNQNLFTGPIASEIGILTNLAYLSIYENQITNTLPSSIGVLTNLRALSIDDNNFSGAIPTSLGALSFVQQLNLYGCFFTGTIPATLNSLANLELLLLHSNMLHGDVAPAFNSSLQVSLTVVDLSYNRFTGSLPMGIFGPSLVSIAAVTTCFSGSIPSAVCLSLNLETVLLAGLTSDCSHKFWPLFAASPYSTRAVRGTIPSCLWNLRNLSVLNLAGNGLTGSIPDLPLYGNITWLDLSYNRLHGAIPTSMQRWPFSNLDLSGNQLNGNIDSLGSQLIPTGATSSSPGMNLSLVSNLLSGSVPIALEFAENINILDGNLFSCSTASPLPLNDPSASEYVCGSNLLDVSMVVFTITGGVALLIVITYFTVRYWDQKLFSGDGIMIQQSNESLEKADGTEKGVGRQRKSEYGGAGRWLIRAGPMRTRSETADLSQKLIPNGIDDDFDALRIAAGSDISGSQYDEWIPGADDSTIEMVPSYDKSVGMLTGLRQGMCMVMKWRHEVDAMFEPPSSRTWQLFHFSLAMTRRTNLLCPDLGRFIATMRLIRRVAVVMTAVILSFLLPMFGGLKDRWGTYQSQYEWALSGVFLSGVYPASWMLAGYIVLITMALVYFAWWLTDGTAAESWAWQTRTADANLSPGHTRVIAISNTSMSSTSITPTKATTVLSSSGGGWCRPIFLFTCLLLGNVVIVLATKGAFTFYLLSYKSTFTLKLLSEIALSIFDMAWGFNVVPNVVSKIDLLSPVQKIVLKTILLWFNNILAPCLVVAVTSTSCFQGVFVRSQAATNAFTYNFCLIYVPGTQESCALRSSWTSIVQFTPPFFYQYTCYSTILSAYIPVFLFSYSFLGFLMPVLTFVLISKPRGKFVQSFFPTLYWLPSHEEIASGKSSHGANEKAAISVITDIAPRHSYAVLCGDKGAQSSIKRTHPSSVNTGASLDVSVVVEQHSAASSSPILPSCCGIGEQDESRGKPLLQTDKILASLLHHVILLMTFGAMFPLLAVAIALVVQIVCAQWEILIGRYLLHMSEHQQQQQQQQQQQTKSTNQASLSTSKNSHGDKGRSTEAVPWPENQFTSSIDAQHPAELSQRDVAGVVTGASRLSVIEELDKCCCHIWRAPRRCVWLLVYCPAIVYALMLFDMIGGQSGSKWQDNLWAPLVTVLSPLAVWFVLQACRWANRCCAQIGKETENDASNSENTVTSSATRGEAGLGDVGERGGRAEAGEGGGGRRTSRSVSGFDTAGSHLRGVFNSQFDGFIGPGRGQNDDRRVGVEAVNDMYCQDGEEDSGNKWRQISEVEMHSAAATTVLL